MKKIKNNQLNMQGNTPKPKKKKHILLKILLIIILFIIVFFITKHFANKSAEKQLNAFIEDYPFKFSDNDTYKTVTKDFEVKNVFKLKNKEYKVTWSSKNNCIKFDGTKAIVNNTSNRNKKVKINANYSILFGLGKASKTYDITVLTKSKLSIDDIKVVTKDSVKNKTYNRNMKMTLTQNGDIASMYGDFKQSIYTKEDCYTFLKAYQTNLNIDKSCDFNLCNTINGNDTTTYVYYLTINNYNIADKKIYISVNNNDYSVNSIKCNFDRDISKYPIPKPQSDELIYNVLSTVYKRNKENTIFAYKDYSYKTINNINYLVGDYYLIYDNNEIHEIYINMNSGKIIKEVDSKKYFTGMTQCTGIGVMGDTKEFDAFKMSEQNNEYALGDLNRNISAFTTASSYLFYGLDNKKMEFYRQFEGVPIVEYAAVVGLLVSYVRSNVEFYFDTNFTSSVIINDGSEFNNMPTAVDGYYNIIKAYDYYKNHFNLISYDNCGAPIPIYIDNKMQKDNACWYPDYKSFFINPTENFKYSFAKDQEVLGHEYTHAVFGEYTSGNSIEIKGLNEAYADIFGVCIKGYDNWKVGQNEYFRSSMLC